MESEWDRHAGQDTLPPQTAGRNIVRTTHDARPEKLRQKGGSSWFLTRLEDGPEQNSLTGLSMLKNVCGKYAKK